MSSYFLNHSKVRVSCAFASGGVATDPTTVSVAVTNPAGTVVTYTYAGATVTKDSTGNYHVDVTPTTEGRWDTEWTATGTVVAGSGTVSFYVG